MEKYCGNGKILIMEKDYGGYNLSNTHGVIRTVLNFVFFFMKIFYTLKKHKNVKEATFAQIFFIGTKKYKIHKKHKTSVVQ